ncbi:hypothetical protein F8388_020414 [Cannabis sativa]|uniref:Pentatricopeptide repeat-containing protein n=1 Tax=Cannabis sativa TaxID=3483 RepID=A0A7J6HJ08_CANSA|nr:hypothetical protein F8388_020414 [Cannabis sativa]
MSCAISMALSTFLGRCTLSFVRIYCEQLKHSGVQVTRDVYMALINAYATCGQFEKAKQIASEKWVPANHLTEVKGVLVQALASHGQISDALNMYDKMKQAGCSLGPKAVISLIEHYESDGGSSTLIQLLEELNDPEYCFDCFTKVFCLIGDLESTHLQIGLELLKVVKENLGLSPPRKCLDFLLHACANAKDLDNARLIWKEYDAVGLPHNILNFIRMYQALLIAGDHKAAKILLTKIPRTIPMFDLLSKHVKQPPPPPSLALSVTISPAFAKSSVDPNSFPIKALQLSKKSAITYPFGFSSLISFVLFQADLELGGSGIVSSVRDFGSWIISDLLRFSMGNDSGGRVVLELGMGNEGSRGSGVGVELHLMENWDESEMGMGWVMEEEEEGQCGSEVEGEWK